MKSDVAEFVGRHNAVRENHVMRPIDVGNHNECTVHIYAKIHAHIGFHRVLS